MTHLEDAVVAGRHRRKSNPKLDDTIYDYHPSPSILQMNQCFDVILQAFFAVHIISTSEPSFHVKWSLLSQRGNNFLSSSLPDLHFLDLHDSDFSMVTVNRKHLDIPILYLILTPKKKNYIQQLAAGAVDLPQKEFWTSTGARKRTNFINGMILSWWIFFLSHFVRK